VCCARRGGPGRLELALGFTVVLGRGRSQSDEKKSVAAESGRGGAEIHQKAKTVLVEYSLELPFLAKEEAVCVCKAPERGDTEMHFNRVVVAVVGGGTELRICFHFVWSLDSVPPPALGKKREKKKGRKKKKRKKKKPTPTNPPLCLHSWDAGGAGEGGIPLPRFRCFMPL